MGVCQNDASSFFTNKAPTFTSQGFVMSKRFCTFRHWKALLCQTESNAPDTGVIYIIRIQPQNSQRLICSFVHKGSILTVLLLNYSSTSIGLLQYSYWITPVLLLDYSSTSIRIHKSTDSCFPAKPISSSTCLLVNFR